MSAKIIEVIAKTEKRGRGIDDDDPVREVLSLWTKDGRCILEVDQWGKPPMTVDVGALREVVGERVIR